MSKYLVKIKNGQWIIPKENIVMLALIKAMDMKAQGIPIQNQEQECETLASQLDFEVQKKECLEQECEELKKVQENGRCAWKSLEGSFCPEAQQQLDQLKAENEKLEEQLELNTANAVVIDMAQRLYKLKQTLAEIKEIAENAIKEMYVTKQDDYTDGYRWLGSIILQKISEVEDE